MAESRNPSHMDYSLLRAFAGAMLVDDMGLAKSMLNNADTAARDHILDFIHPGHWSLFGYSAFDKEYSVEKYERMFGKQDSDAISHEPGDVVLYLVVHEHEDGPSTYTVVRNAGEEFDLDDFIEEADIDFEPEKEETIHSEVVDLPEGFVIARDQ